MVRQTYFNAWRKYKKLPPGPNGIPLVGTLVTRLLYGRQNLNLPSKYGPIVYYPNIGFDRVLINDSKIVKQLFIANLDRLSPADRIAVTYYHSIWSVGPDHGHQSWPLLFENGDKWNKKKTCTIHII